MENEERASFLYVGGFRKHRDKSYRIRDIPIAAAVESCLAANIRHRRGGSSDQLPGNDAGLRRGMVDAVVILDGYGKISETHHVFLPKWRELWCF